MAIKVAKAVDFPGEAQVTLIGLPNKVTTDVKKITKDTTDLVFHIKTDKVSPAGNHASLFCQVVITQNGEPIVHNIGTRHPADRRAASPQGQRAGACAGGRGRPQAGGRRRRQAADPAREAPAGEQTGESRWQVIASKMARPSGREWSTVYGRAMILNQGLDRNESHCPPRSSGSAWSVCSGLLGCRHLPLPATATHRRPARRRSSRPKRWRR